MIVTEEGKNIYPEDIENVFEGLPVKEFCVFAANYLWPERTMVGEKLVLVLRAEPGHAIGGDTIAKLAERNRRLANYKRVSGYLIWDADFPRTASLKIKRWSLQSRFARALAANRWCLCDFGSTEGAIFRDRESGGRGRALRPTRSGGARSRAASGNRTRSGADHKSRRGDRARACSIRERRSQFSRGRRRRHGI